MADVDSEIRDVFEDICRAIPGMSVKEYPATPGKLGLRYQGGQVVLTYNSYKRGWLDTTADLGPKLRWFRFQPTHNKPDQYWAVKLAPDNVRGIYQAHRAEILAALRAALGLRAAATPQPEPEPARIGPEQQAQPPLERIVDQPCGAGADGTVQKCFLNVFQCSRRGTCAKQFAEMDSEFPPQPGFVGARYGSSRLRVLVLAQNPGHASRACHNPDEARMYALWQTAAETKTDVDFGKCMAFLRSFMDSWPIFEKARLSERFALTLDDVAYFNILKCKTKENRTPSAVLYQTCAQQTTRRQLEVLAPGYVLCFGKAVFEQVEAITAALRIPCNWILHPSGQHYRPPAQQERVKAVSAELSAIRQTR